MNCRRSRSHGFMGAGGARWRRLCSVRLGVLSKDGTASICIAESTIRQLADAAAPRVHWTLICACVSVASNISVDGHAGQTTPSAALFGSPLRMKAEIVLIIAADSA